MRQSGEPWDVCKKSYAVCKVVVSEGWPINTYAKAIAHLCVVRKLMFVDRAAFHHRSG